MDSFIAAWRNVLFGGGRLELGLLERYGEFGVFYCGKFAIATCAVDLLRLEIPIDV